MAKPKTAYVCAECGAHSVKWAGQCPDCGAWNTLSEVRVAGTAASSGAAAAGLDALQLDAEQRYATGFAEFDRVLGGGLVPGAVVLLGGDPGVGKSTLLQQVSAQLQSRSAVLYATGEESLRQVSQRARRLALGESGLQVLADTALDNVLAEAQRNASRVLVIDSMQTMTAAALTSAPGSVAQLRECVGRTVRFAKQNEVSVFVIGHVTKEGAIAGPRVVEHMVDTVLYFEADPASRYTMIRSVKNRFGATGEVGVFAMTGKGLLLTKLIDSIPPTSKLPSADTQFFADQRIGHPWFIGSLQSLPFKLCAISLPSCHKTPPDALSRQSQVSTKSMQDQEAVTNQLFTLAPYIDPINS